jgi:hypothetical protein
VEQDLILQAVRLFACPPHSPLVGRVVNLEGARLFFRRVLDNLAVLRSLPGVLGRWAFLFLNQLGCVSPEIGLTFCYELAMKVRQIGLQVAQDLRP